MKEQMKRTVYEAPITELYRIELEGSFCGSADVANPDDAEIGRIDEHQVNTDFTSAGDFSSGSWD